MTVRGVDYSHWQSPPNTSYPPNVTLMAADGIEFFIVKAWEGDSPDPNFKENWRNLEGKPRLAYVWLHESDDDARRDKCFDYIGEAVIMLDWEQEGVSSVTVENW